MSEAPERIWTCPDDAEWITGHWDRASDGLPMEAEYIRADHAQAEKEAAVAAEREACISRLESLKDTAYQNKFLAGGVTYSCAIDAIRARADTDPLEAAKAEARAEALRELLQVNRVHRDKNWYPSLEQSILALLPADQEGDG